MTERFRDGHDIDTRSKKIARERMPQVVKTHLVQQLLTVLGIPPDTVSREIAAMQPTAFASAVNRRVLGSMNEFAWQVGAYLGRTDDALELARRLSDTPMSAVGSKARYGVPREVARELLAAPYVGSPFRH